MNPIKTMLDAVTGLLERAEHCERTGQPRMAELYRVNARVNIAKARQLIVVGRWTDGIIRISEAIQEVGRVSERVAEQLNTFNFKREGIIK